MNASIGGDAPVANEQAMRGYEVVVLGAGYAGLMAALGLAAASPLQRILLVSESDVFVERIRLQEALIAPVAPRLPPLKALLAGTKVEFLCGEAVALDPERRRVGVLAGGERIEIGYERCVFALGSAGGVTEAVGAADHAYRLDPGDGPRSAASLRARLVAFRGRPMRVVVVGGGNTATEAAGEIKAAYRAAEVLMVSRSRGGDFGKGRRLEAVVRSELTRLGVRIVDGETIVEVRPDGVVTASGRCLTADVCVWAAGVRTARLAAEAGLAVDPNGRILADGRLSSVSHPDILAVGDALAPMAPTGARYRLSAFASLATGAYAAKRLIAEQRGRIAPPFSFTAYGQGVSIGERGVGFFSFPDDTAAYMVVRGPLALRIRNLFVWSLVFFLRLERRWPGSALFRIGRRRASSNRLAANQPPPQAAARAEASPPNREQRQA